MKTQDEIALLKKLQAQMAALVAQDVAHSDELDELDIELTENAAVTDGKFDVTKIKSGKKYGKRYK